jgi:potassium-dependent mechanosensitive channel
MTNPPSQVDTYAELANQFTMLVVFLQRPAVLLQLGAIAIAIGLAWLLSQGIRRWLRQPLLGLLGKLPTRLHNRLLLCRSLLLPVLLIQGMRIIRWLFLWQGGDFGLIDFGGNLVRIYFLYRLALVIVGEVYSPALVQTYRQRFFDPLFGLFVLLATMSLVFDLPRLATLPLLQVFGGSLTLRALFLVTFGLYFWIVGSSLVAGVLGQGFARGWALSEGAVYATSLIARYLLIGFGIVVIFGAAGFNATAFAAITGGLSIGIGFGLKEIFSNFISGIWLLFEGSLRPGDLIYIGSDLCKVEKLGIRAATVMVMRDNSERIIPNQTFFTSDVTTQTGSNRIVRRTLAVSASYADDPDKVIEVLQRVAHEHPRVLVDPAPSVSLTAFGDSSINFQLNFCLGDPMGASQVVTQLASAVWHAFDQEGIEMPFPQRDLHIRDSKGISVELQRLPKKE